MSDMNKTMKKVHSVYNTNQNNGSTYYNSSNNSQGPNQEKDLFVNKLNIVKKPKLMMCYKIKNVN
jgi:hypothetical protein